ncbi:MAG: acetate--CoA ligase family protein [bacterium]
MNGDQPDARLAAGFSPRVVAVVGASPNGGIGAQVLANIVAGGFTGTVFAVHPTATAVAGARAFATMGAVPGPVDLAVVCVPAGRVVDVVRDCGRCGVKAVVVISAGFREAGEAGARLERELRAAVRDGGMRMIGPNCLGIMNMDPSIRLNATFAATQGHDGGAALMTQSGAIGIALLEHTAATRLGLARFASMGNKTDVSGNDLLLLWEDDPMVKTVLLYLESLGNPRNFLRIASRVGRKKPILVLKSGRSEAGARAAASHTGALAASDAMVTALFSQAGVLRAATVEEFLDIAQALEGSVMPHGPRVAIVTNSGGPGILAMDALAASGLAPAALSEKTQNALRPLLPAAASLANPIDLLASGGPREYATTIATLAEDSEVDAIIAIHTPTASWPEADVAQALVGSARNAGKSVLVVFMSGTRRSPGYTTLLEAHVATYSFPENAVAALGALGRLDGFRRRDAGAHPAIGEDRPAVRSIIARVVADGREWLKQHEALALVAAYGIPVARHAAVTSVDGAVQAAEWIGYPVVLKAESPRLLHKSDTGGVRLGLKDAADVRAAFAAMKRDLAGRGIALDEAVVMQHAPTGTELILGATHHASFGPAVAFGLGGVHAEVLADVAVGLAPLSDAECGRLVRSIRGWALLAGHRAPPADVMALEAAVLRISRLAADFPDIAELDLNPVVAYAVGGGALALDARIRIAAVSSPSAASPSP